METGEERGGVRERKRGRRDREEEEEVRKKVEGRRNKEGGE